MKTKRIVYSIIVLLMITTTLTILVPNINPVAAADSSGTFGSSSVGSGFVGTGGVAAKTGGRFLLSSAGSVSQLTAYIRGSGYAKAAIYADSNGAPGSLVGGVTQQMTVPSSAGWVNFVYSAPVSLSAGYYWLTLIYDSGCSWSYGSGGVSAWNYVNYYNAPLSAFGSYTGRTDLISIYATYSGSGSSSGSSGTFGSSSVGSGFVGTGGVAAKTGGRFLLSSAGSVSQLTAYIRGSGYAKAAIYADSNGAPGSLVGGVTQQMTVPSSAGWVNFVYSAPVSLSAGYYWLTLIYDSGCSWSYGSGGVSAWNYVNYYNAPLSAFGSYTGRTDLISIYATYSGSGSSSGSSGTFGSSSVGSGFVGTGGVAAKTGGRFLLSSAGSVSQLTAYIRGSGYAKAAIYADSNGAPGSLVGGVTQQMTVPSSAGWVNFVYSAPVSLSAGYYWLTLIYDSGCSWSYGSGGVSAWNYVNYYNAPLSAFGSYTGRTDLISIYATYSGSGSSTITSQSRSVQRGGFANYMTWNGVWMAQQAFDFAKSSFNTMILGGYRWDSYTVSAIQSFKNAGMMLYGYTRLAQVEYSSSSTSGSLDWAEANTHEDWFIHDAVTGSRIWNPNDGGFLMDIGNSGFRQHWTTFVRNNLNTYQGFNGIFIDNTIGTINPNWLPWTRYNGGGQPSFKSTDVNNWHTNVVSFLAQINAAFPDKSVIINIDGIYYDYVNQVDGVTIEGFSHANYQSINTYNGPDVTKSQIDFFGSVTGSGKVAWYYSGTPDGTTSQINNLVKYCFAGALISNNNPQSIFSFNDWFSFDGSNGYYSIIDTKIGQPTAAYYQSQNVYIRDYSGGKVLFNPTANTYTINLENTYTLCSGGGVSSVTLGPHSGEVLLR